MLIKLDKKTFERMKNNKETLIRIKYVTLPNLKNFSSEDSEECLQKWVYPLENKLSEFAKKIYEGHKYIYNGLNCNTLFLEIFEGIQDLKEFLQGYIKFVNARKS